MSTMLVSALVMSLGLGPVAASAWQPEVDVGYAIYVGNHSRPNTAAFLGIPYAEPPVGERRFRAPVPVDTAKLRRNKTLFDASTYPNFCIQGRYGENVGGAGSEDCLKVNIYAPVNATSESKFPVLVYIHGGGYLVGNPENLPFDHWVDQSPNVVIVSLYYRLTVFGFLAQPSLEDDPKLGSLNAGFLDQIQALRWVQSYISAFGGDPQRVTINGQSAGGSSVELHLVANIENPPLFSAAIAQSVYRITLPTPKEQVPLFEYLLKNTSCTRGTIGDQMSCLRSASVSALIRSADSSFQFFSGEFRQWIPVLDSTILTDAPTKLILGGKWAKVPIMVGATSNETTFSGNVSADLKNLFPPLTPRVIQQFLDEYPEKEFASPTQRGMTLVGEPLFRCGRELLAEAAHKAKLPAFAYRYNQPNPTLGNNKVVAHAAENWMMFLGSNIGFNGSAVFTGLNATETAFSEELIGYWLSFVRSGNPNTYKAARSPIWPSFATTPSSHDRQRLVLQQDPNNTTSASGVVSEAEPQIEVERCDFGFRKADILVH